MTDEQAIREFAGRYAGAWGTHDPARVASFYAPMGTITINGGPPSPVADVANGFITVFPDIQVYSDEVVFRHQVVLFHWTFTGTNSGPGGTGESVRISGFEVSRR